MTVWAHPDDESYLSAGIMACAASNGQLVVCITATKGEAGSQDYNKWPPAKLGQVRARELSKALKALGISNHHWLGYADGCCQQADRRQAVNKLRKLIEQYQPDSILTFGSDGLTGHDDHACISDWVSESVRGKESLEIYHAVHTFDQYEKYLKKADEKLNIFFNIEQPPLRDEADCDICFNLPPEICEMKCNAVAAMPSQTEIFFKLFGRNYIKDTFKTEYFIKAEK